MTYEWEMLNRKVKNVNQRTETILKRKLGETRTLDYLKGKDRMRLTILLIWEERYRVSLEEILEFLLDHFIRIAKGQKHRKKMGLPVRVNSLVSKTTEQLLKDHLEQQYPIGVREKLHRQIVRQEFLKDNDEEWVKRKTVLDFETLEQYHQYYQSKMERTRQQREQKMMTLKQQTLPYRGNPWS